jgi:hypothetical protein
LLLEYEAVGIREAARQGFPENSVQAIVRAFCYYGVEAQVYFRLRPTLPDPVDEFLLELAVAGRASIVTWNVTPGRCGPLWDTCADAARVFEENRR